MKQTWGINKEALGANAPSWKKMADTPILFVFFVIFGDSVRKSGVTHPLPVGGGGE